MNLSKLPKTDSRYYEAIEKNIYEVESKQIDNILKAAEEMARAVKEDRLINLYGGGGHTTLVMAEMFFRAGGLACINPIMDIGISTFNNAYKYLALERTENYATGLVKYYRLKPGDVFLIFHNIGVNAATIDAVLEAKKAGAVIIAVSSGYWQNGLPMDHFLRHSSKKNLFELADICIDDYNPLGDAVIKFSELDVPIAPVSNIVDFYIAHRLEIECIKKLIEWGIEAPVWKSANVPGGDEYNQKLHEKYNPRIKSL
ncbi:MAG: hypothetical protein A2096_02405 [Spirochaetes bacterium GWF1_41_5]|nr:MAG: hypothetical protein A2096_02405 [Spirochaetes bacterium GWF1_41_5]HBE01315.1 sugar isomerase [Spirochaetia bacterium]